MKRKRFSTEQIVAALKQVELGLPVADLIRQLGISEQTYYRWKKSYDGLESDQVREHRQVAWCASVARLRQCSWKMAPSSPGRSSISGLAIPRCAWTSRGHELRPTMPKSSRSTARSETNA